ncbi:MAG: PaaI family thioesterase [Myxococcaceae bacterium]|nr:PaaI family thioesterase [Myxococcaceae bacterium]
MKSVQETWAPNNACFGCGPTNEKGLRIRSFEEGDALVAEWTPQPHHEAFPGVLNGGIIGSLLDCHCNWAAIMHLKRLKGMTDKAPCCVTADYSIQLKRPCPTNVPLRLRARVVATDGDKATVEGSIEADGKVRATCKGTFIAVEPGHPAYHRW